MLFNSTGFLVFLPIVFFFYWFILNRKIQLQNLFLLIASYVFYGWWDWRFLLLIVTSSSIDFIIAKAFFSQHSQSAKKLLLGVSIVANLGILAFFKYYNFFIQSLQLAFKTMDVELNSHTLQIILPVGISFYTFQTMSYTIDVYRQKIEPERNIFSFFTYVSFFPQLVAGPIERAWHLLPQFKTQRIFNQKLATNGLQLILWGLFKKIVIADTCALYVNYIYTNYEFLPGGVLWLGTFLFAFQVYGDFSGYSDIAIGTAALFGIILMRNFAYPYFSRNIIEFWRRWHISLSSWFRDYVYIPLGGSKGSKLLIVRNIVIVFVLSGLWHGANLTYIVWGFYNAVLFLLTLLIFRRKFSREIVAEHHFFPDFKEIFQLIITFILVIFGYVYFRSQSVTDAHIYMAKLLTSGLTFDISYLHIYNIGLKSISIILLLIIALVSVEWLQRKKMHPLQFDDIKMPVTLKWGIYYVLTILILYFYSGEKPFIYFQF